MCQSNMTVTVSDGTLATSRRPSKSQIIPAKLEHEMCGASHESLGPETKKDGAAAASAADTCPGLVESEDLCLDDLCSETSSERDDDFDVERRAPPSPMMRPRRSILKQPSIDILTASRSDSSAFRVAAAISLKPTRVKRSTSMPPNYGEEDGSPRRNSSVTFDKVHFREHAMTVGDHPDCTYGPPVSLDWDVVEHKAIDLESYEGCRDKRRNMRQLQMNAWHRKNLLTFKFGLTEGELDAATKEKNKARRQRSQTRTLLPAMKIEDGLRSAGRKFRRAVNSDVRKSEKEMKEFVKRHSSTTLNSIDASTLAELRALDSDEDEA